MSDLIKDIEKDIKEKEVELKSIREEANIVNYIFGPVPNKKHAEMTEDERDKVMKWVLSDSKEQEKEYLSKWERIGYLTAYLREAYCMLEMLRSLERI